MGAAAQQVMATRKKIRDEWNAWRAQCDERYAAQREERAKLRGGDGEPVYSDVEDEDEDGEEMVEEWTEEVIEETEEVVVE